MPEQSVTIPALFDTHVHFREAKIAREYVWMSQRCSRAAIAMPNLKSPLVNAEACSAYLHALKKYAEPGHTTQSFEPFLYAYLDRHMTHETLTEILKVPRIVGVKLYPHAATTGSSYGITEQDLRSPPVRLLDCVKLLEEQQRVLSIHGEMPSAFVLDREREFLKSGFLETLFRVAPNLRVSLEHISTTDAVDFVRKLNSDGKNIVATITLQHIKHDVGHVVGMPYHFCRPCPAMPKDRQAIAMAALCAEDYIMLGSDSAPHTADSKECRCCSAGCYTAPTLIEELTEMFYQTKFVGYSKPWTERLRRFTSGNALAFHKTFENFISDREMTLVPEEWVPNHPSVERTPYYCNPTLQWRIASGGSSADSIQERLDAVIEAPAGV